MPIERRERLIYAAAWLALMTIYSAALVANSLPIGLAIRNAIASLLPDALLGLLVMRLPMLLRGRSIAAHAGAMIAFIVIAAAGWVALIALDSLLFTGRVAVQINYRIIPFRIVNDVLIFCTLAGVAYVRDQAERAAKAEALRARASLEAMRSQLNPHFILNTFHALVGLVRRDPAAAESAIERLGDLLRYSLRMQRDGIDEVPLRDECAFVESYLAIESLRLADRLRVSVDTPPETLECRVPTFAVQILVENAIRHAIAPRASGGLLEVRAEQANGRLRLTVKDQGNGEAAAGHLDGSGMGLRLLQDRLAALYANDASLTLRKVDGGTLADLDLPARRGAQEES